MGSFLDFLSKLHSSLSDLNTSFQMHYQLAFVTYCFLVNNHRQCPCLQDSGPKVSTFDEVINGLTSKAKIKR